MIPLNQGDATFFTAAGKGQDQVQILIPICLYELLSHLVLFLASQVVLQCRYGHMNIVLLANVIIQSVNLRTLDRYHQFPSWSYCEPVIIYLLRHVLFMVRIQAFK